MLQVDKLFSSEIINVILSNPSQVKFLAFCTLKQEWRTDKDMQNPSSTSAELKHWN